MAEFDNSIDIDSFWEYTDPDASEERFQSALKDAQGDKRLELLTQIARTYGLRGQFERAHEILDQVEGQLADSGVRPRVRYLLERGRAFNSSGKGETARALFRDAWERARTAQLEGLAVDAAHMVAITYAGEPEAIAWNQRGLKLARNSKDSKAQALIPAMLNNTAWDLHDMGRFEGALPFFEEALEEWRKRDKPRQTRFAKWAVARCLRSLGQHEQAMVFLAELEVEYQAIGSVDGYVFEEMAENLLALGDPKNARPYFKRALDELGNDEWFVRNESERLARLRSQAGEN